MAGLGGKRPGAGRPKGSRNRRREEQARAIAASGLTPLNYLLSVLRDVNASAERRLDAAKAAAPYVHPKLASITHKGDEGAPMQIVISQTDATL